MDPLKVQVKTPREAKTGKFSPAFPASARLPKNAIYTTVLPGTAYVLNVKPRVALIFT